MICQAFCKSRSASLARAVLAIIKKRPLPAQVQEHILQILANELSAYTPLDSSIGEMYTSPLLTLSLIQLCLLRKLMGITIPSKTTASPSHDRKTLEDLPTEVLEEISRLACTDGGYTGCFLSQVSHRMRAVSRTARFHSISLLSGSPDRLRLFLNCFKEARGIAQVPGHATLKTDRRAREEGAATPRIRHLCLATTQCAPATVAPERAESLLALVDRHYWYAIRLLGEESKVSSGTTDQYRSLVQELFHLTCEDLETLCVYGPQDWGPTHRTMLTFSVPRGFPKLRELSTAGFEPQFVALSARRPLFPVLSRLHVVAETSRPRPVDFRRWVGDAPSLETLRVTCDNCFARPDWIESLQCVITAVGETEKNPCLRIMVLMKPIPMSRLTGITIRYHNIASALAKQLRHAHLPVAFVPYYSSEDVNGAFAIRPRGMEEHVRRDWLLRMEGRNVFLDDFWWTPRDDSFGEKFRMWWLYGKLYLPPTIRRRRCHRTSG